jgi:hypothetical protein
MYEESSVIACACPYRIVLLKLPYALYHGAGPKLHDENLDRVAINFMPGNNHPKEV